MAAGLGFGSWFRWIKASHFEIRDQLVGNLRKDRLGQSCHWSLEGQTGFRDVRLLTSWSRSFVERKKKKYIEPYIFELSVRDKLDDVSGNGLPYCRLQHSIVSIKKLHGLEVSRPHPHNDDRQRKPRRPDDGIPGLVEVRNLTISEDEEDKVLLQRDTCRG